MKKILFSFFAVTLIVGAVHLPANATNITVGAYSWMAFYDATGTNSMDLSDDPFFMTGPVISVGFTKQLSFSSVILAGVMKDLDMGMGSKDDLIRIDSDNALNYKISKQFKLFGGVKVMHYENSKSPVSKWTAFGPSAGISHTLPLGNSFFMLSSFSFIYMPAKARGVMGDEWTQNIGFNTTLSFAYYITKAKVAIALGARWQTWSDDSIDFEQWSHISGVTLSAVYAFTI